jgi:hypothetical protein
VVKRPARDVDQSPPSSAEVKDEWSYTSTPLICLHGMDRDNFASLGFEDYGLLEFEILSFAVLSAH